MATDTSRAPLDGSPALAKRIIIQAIQADEALRNVDPYHPNMPISDQAVGNTLRALRESVEEGLALYGDSDD